MIEEIVDCGIEELTNDDILELFIHTIKEEHKDLTFQVRVEIAGGIFKALLAIAVHITSSRAALQRHSDWLTGPNYAWLFWTTNG